MTRRVTWRGVTVDQRTAHMLDEVAVLSGSIYVRPTQGSFSGSVSASAGTHDGCGAVDIITGSPDQMRRLVPIMRRVGFAAWLRTPAQSSWPYHVHAIAVQPGGKTDRGCLSTGAHAQVIDYYNGLNGLAGRGRDDATRAHVGTTWETYKRDKDEDMPLTDQDIDKIAAAVANAVNRALGDYTAGGKQVDDQGDLAGQRLRQIERIVRRIEDKTG